MLDLKSENVKYTYKNEDARFNFTQLTSKYGYHSEEHHLETKDGYILTIFRIPLGKKCISEVKPIPVLMMHGLIDSSDAYIIAGPDVGLAYILADACYDVWCGNVRGNIYSRNHVTLKPDYDKEFWNYSYHEHGIYDLSAIVDYVLHKAKARSVNYIAHSQGTTAFLVLNSLLPKYQNKFKIALLLAPIAWLYHVTSPFFKTVGANYHSLRPALEQAGVHEILSQSENAFNFFKFLCQFLPQCRSAIRVLFGDRLENISSITLSAVVGHLPAGTSIKNLEHYAQAVQENVFQQYNYYGAEKNTEAYREGNPPEYELTKIQVPIVLFSSESDMISRPKDIDKLVLRLPNVVDSIVFSNDSWGHLNFVIGDQIPIVIAPQVLKYLKKWSSTVPSITAK